MKALELLKKERKLFQEAKEAYEENDGACHDFDIESISVSLKQIEEAIIELEEMENHNCETCKHFDKRPPTSKGICLLLGNGDIGGCGDYWEAKYD